MSGARFCARFWGVRGGFPTPNAATRRYGGNTACVEVRCGPHLVILDAGTGIRPLGLSLLAEAEIDADIMFSQTRFNHMCGLPFFMPGYNPKNTFRAWAGHRGALGSMQRELTGMMTSPLFPIPLSYIGALKSFHDFAAGDSFEPKPGIMVRSAPLEHPNGATGYRIEYDGRALCYVSGTQHRPNKPNPTVLSLIERADLVIYDSFYADEEYVPNDVGHSTWQEGIRLCRTAGARRLAPFQHNPAHDDAYLDRVQAEIEAALPGSRVAAEGLVLEL